MSHKIVPADLESFARTGQLGPLLLGISRSEVSAILGQPADWLNGKSIDRSVIWKYGDIELHFRPDDDRLYMIHFDWFDVPTGGSSIQLNPWVIRRGLSLIELENALRSADIPFTSARDKFNPDCVQVVT